MGEEGADRARAGSTKSTDHFYNTSSLRLDPLIAQAE